MTERDKLIYGYLTKQGINCSLSGYSFLVTAISYVLDNPGASANDFTAYTASHHNTTSLRVKGSMRYALKSSKNVLATQKPKEFVYTAVRSLRESTKIQ